MNELLTLDGVALSYHTREGETEALKSVSFSARSMALKITLFCFRSSMSVS